jgi:hypothetical protein
MALFDRTEQSSALNIKQQIKDKITSGELTREQVEKLISQLETKQAGPSIGNRILSGAETAGNLFLQMGGLQAPARSTVKGPSAIDELAKQQNLMLQQQKADVELRKAERAEELDMLKLEKERAALEEQNRLRQGLSGGGGPAGVAPIQEPTLEPSRIPTELDQAGAITGDIAEPAQPFIPTSARTAEPPAPEFEVITKPDGTLERVETEASKTRRGLFKKQQESEITISKGVGAQEQKDILKSGQNLINAELKIDNTLDSFLDTVETTMKLTGVGPGIFGGTLTKILGETKANEFYQGFKGGLIEYAAAAGQISIPGSRATRLVNLFKETAPTSFDTVESAIQNSADSFRNSLASDMSRNQEEYIKGYSKLSGEKKMDARENLKDILRSFEEKYKYGTLSRVWKRNKKLLKPETLIDLEQRILYDEENDSFAVQFSDGTFKEIR